MTAEDATETLTEALITAEILNRHENLGISDLPPYLRSLFDTNGSGELKRPVVVSTGSVKKALGIPDALALLNGHPFVKHEEFGQRLSVTSLEPAISWFLSHGGTAAAGRNPAFAFELQSQARQVVPYEDVLAANPPYEDSRSYLDRTISRIIADDEHLRGALDLMIINAPEEVEQEIAGLVITPEQKSVIAKLNVAIRHIDYLRRHRITEIGKLLFVGPPGTGKTSLALAMAHVMHMPILEVRLPMITSQYLGETSKNIERIFDFARKVAPCILFIDEFDYLAKSRVSDDHGAMKRAVNALLKNIDRVTMIKNRVILVAATNHPQLLDEAAWRRFDEVVEFPLPTLEMREEILRTFLGPFETTCDYKELARETEGFSGADLKMMVREAVLAALTDGRRNLTADDIEQGSLMVKGRTIIRKIHSS